MAKYVPSTPKSITGISAELTKIAAVLEDQLSKVDLESNAMMGDLNMNGFNIYNLKSSLDTGDSDHTHDEFDHTHDPDHEDYDPDHTHDHTHDPYVLPDNVATTNWVDSNYMAHSGGDFTGPVTVGYPLLDLNPATKQYVDSSIANIPEQDHSIYATWDDADPTFTQPIHGISPTEAFHYTTKSYVDTAIDNIQEGDGGGVVLPPDTSVYASFPVGGTFSAPVSGLSPTGSGNFATKGYVDTEINTHTAIDPVKVVTQAVGGTMAAPLGGLEPSSPSDFATRNYVDNSSSASPDTSKYAHFDHGGIFNQALGGIAPTQDYHFATKSYADSLSGGAPDSAIYAKFDTGGEFTDYVSGPTPVNDFDYATKAYVDGKETSTVNLDLSLVVAAFHNKTDLIDAKTVNGGGYSLSTAASNKSLVAVASVDGSGEPATMAHFQIYSKAAFGTPDGYVSFYVGGSYVAVLRSPTKEVDCRVFGCKDSTITSSFDNSLPIKAAVRAGYTPVIPKNHTFRIKTQMGFYRSSGITQVTIKGECSETSIIDIQDLGGNYYTGGWITVYGRRTSLGTTNKELKEGGMFWPSSSISGELQRGDYACISDPTEYKGGQHRSYFRTGYTCMAAEEAISTGVTLDVAAQDNYISGSSIYKIEPVGVHLEGFNVKDMKKIAYSYASKAECSVGSFYHCAPFVVHNVRSVGAFISTIYCKYCFRGSIRDCNLASLYFRHQWKDGQWVEYISAVENLQFANCQDMIVDNCWLQGQKHANNIGGGGSDSKTQCRKITYINCNLNCTSQYTADIHGGGRDCTYQNCVISGGCVLGGRNSTYDNCKIYTRDDTRQSHRTSPAPTHSAFYNEELDHTSLTKVKNCQIYVPARRQDRKGACLHLVTSGGDTSNSNIQYLNNIIEYTGNTIHFENNNGESDDANIFEVDFYDNKGNLGDDTVLNIDLIFKDNHFIMENGARGMIYLKPNNTNNHLRKLVFEGNSGNDMGCNGIGTQYNWGGKMNPASSAETVVFKQGAMDFYNCTYMLDVDNCKNIEVPDPINVTVRSTSDTDVARWLLESTSTNSIMLEVQVAGSVDSGYARWRVDGTGIVEEANTTGGRAKLVKSGNNILLKAKADSSSQPSKVKFWFTHCQNGTMGLQILARP